MDFSPLFISLRAAVCSTILSFFLGIYAAKLVYKTKRFKSVLDIIFTLPLVLPPTVIGYFLLLALGKNSFIGSFLSGYNISFVFSPAATIIAATVAAFPLMYRTVIGAFDQIDKNIIYAARTLGSTEHKIFWRIMLPNIIPSILAGTVLAFTRSIGEFGTTMMIAGNIPGKTQTMSISVYNAMQSGNKDLANRWVIIILIISFLCIFAMNFWLTRPSKLIKTEN